MGAHRRSRLGRVYPSGGGHPIEGDGTRLTGVGTDPHNGPTSKGIACPPSPAALRASLRSATVDPVRVAAPRSGSPASPVWVRSGRRAAPRGGAGGALARHRARRCSGRRRAGVSVLEADGLSDQRRAVELDARDSESPLDPFEHPVLHRHHRPARVFTFALMRSCNSLSGRRESRTRPVVHTCSAVLQQVAKVYRRAAIAERSNLAVTHEVYVGSCRKAVTKRRW